MSRFQILKYSSVILSGIVIGFILAHTVSILDYEVLEIFILEEMATYLAGIFTIVIIISLFILFKGHIFKAVIRGVRHGGIKASESFGLVLTFILNPFKSPTDWTQQKDSLAKAVTTLTEYLVAKSIMVFLWRIIFGLFFGMVSFAGTYLLLKQNEIMRLEVAQQQFKLPDEFREKLISNRFKPDNVVLQMNFTDCEEVHVDSARSNEEKSTDNEYVIVHRIEVSINKKPTPYLNYDDSFTLKNEGLVIPNEIGVQYVANVSEQTKLDDQAKDIALLLTQDLNSSISFGSYLLLEELGRDKTHSLDIFDRLEISVSQMFVDEYEPSDLSGVTFRIHESYFEINICSDCDKNLDESNHNFESYGSVLEIYPYFFYNKKYPHFWLEGSILILRDYTVNGDPFCSEQDTVSDCFDFISSLVSNFLRSTDGETDNIYIIETELDIELERDKKVLSLLKRHFNNDWYDSDKIFFSFFDFARQIKGNPQLCSSATSGSINCSISSYSESRTYWTECLSKEAEPKLLQLNKN